MTPPSTRSARRRIGSLVAASLLLAACGSGSQEGEASPPPAGPVTEVLVLGMIHSGHLESETWGLDQVRKTIRRIEPDVVCAEIPPDRWPRIESDWRDRGVLEDERIRVFPEYTEVLLPLMLELEFEVAPCAAWTKEMADERRAKIAAFESEARFAEELARYQEENGAIRARHEANPIDDDDPHVIHSALYDSRVEEELVPYDHYLNDWIGAGGWTNINAAHFDLIEKTIEAHRGERILITFGAGHKYWFLRSLSERDDVVLIDVTPFLPPPADAGEDGPGA